MGAQEITISEISLEIDAGIIRSVTAPILRKDVAKIPVRTYTDGPVELCPHPPHEGLNHHRAQRMYRRQRRGYSPYRRATRKRASLLFWGWVAFLLACLFATATFDGTQDRELKSGQDLRNP